MSTEGPSKDWVANARDGLEESEQGLRQELERSNSVIQSLRKSKKDAKTSCQLAVRRLGTFEELNEKLCSFCAVATPHLPQSLDRGHVDFRKCIICKQSLSNTFSATNAKPAISVLDAASNALKHFEVTTGKLEHGLSLESDNGGVDSTAVLSRFTFNRRDASSLINNTRAAKARRLNPEQTQDQATAKLKEVRNSVKSWKKVHELAIKQALAEAKANLKQAEDSLQSWTLHRDLLVSKIREVETASVNLQDRVRKSLTAKLEAFGGSAVPKCAICMEREKDTAFVCGHQCCAVCSFSMQTCHTCRREITHRIKLYD